MNGKIKRWLAVLLTVTLIPLAAVAQSASSDTEPTRYYMPDYFAQTSLDISQYKGKAVFMNFFTGWCQYCMQEMPDLKKVYDEYDPNDVAVILVHAWDGENADDSAAVVEKFGLQGVTLIEDQDLTLTGMFVQGYPTSMFIDQDGYMSVGHYQSGMLTYEDMTSLLGEMGVQKKSDASANPTAASTVAPTATPKGSASVDGVSSATMGKRK